MKLIDKSNGYIFAGIEGSAVEFSKIAAGPLDWDYYRYPFLMDVYYPYPSSNQDMVLIGGIDTIPHRFYTKVWSGT